MLVAAVTFFQVHPNALRAGGTGCPRCRGVIPASWKEVTVYDRSVFLAEAGVRCGLFPVSVWQVGARLLPLPVLAKALTRLG